MGLKSLQAKMVNKVIEGFKMNKEKKARFNNLANELIDKFVKTTAKPESELLQDKLEKIAADWGLPVKVVSGANKPEEYHLLARLIAAPVILAQ